MNENKGGACEFVIVNIPELNRCKILEYLKKPLIKS